MSVPLNDQESNMNTTSIAMLSAAIVAGAIIIASSKYESTTPSETTPGAHAPPVDGGGEGNTVLRAPPEKSASKGDVAKLRADLADALEQIEILKRKAESGNAAAGDDSGMKAESLEASSARFRELMLARTNGTMTKKDMAEWVMLSKNKSLMAHMVGELEQRVSDNPADVEARLRLAGIESARVHLAESITERAMLGKNVRTQIEEVLKLDPNNWKARYMRAVGISHSQRTPQGRANAISEFQSLIKLQDSLPTEPRFAQPYGQLARVYMAQRDTQNAEQAVRRGLEIDPASKDLQELLNQLVSASK